MSHLIREHFNSYQTMHNWRVEDGCKRLTVGHSSTRIVDINKTDLLVIILQRIQRHLNGFLHILQTKIEVDKEVMLVDSTGHSATFIPIGVIEHQGTVSGKSVTGHYTADILSYSTGQWYHNLTALYHKP